MKKLTYILIFLSGMSFFQSCLINNETDLHLNAEGKNLVTLERIETNLTGEANGSEYTFLVPIKIVGPTVADLTSDITVTIVPTDESTAVDGDMYRIVNPVITLKKSNNYLDNIEIILVTEGNTPPMDDTPEFLLYVAPVLYVDFTVTGDANVTGSGKGGTLTLNYTAPNPYAGIYDVEMRYFHPTAGGSYPPDPTDPAFNPDDPYGGVRFSQKELVAVTGRKCETTFAVWDDLCWITVNLDNTITYIVDDTWTLDVSLGNPYNAAQVTHFDPVTREIIMYYNYLGASGYRVFWEYFTPTF